MDELNRDFSEDTSSTASRIGQQASQKVSQVREKAAEMGRRAGEKIDEQRNRAADTMEDTASVLHERTDRYAERATGAAHATADRLQSAAEYLRENDARAMMEDIGDWVRRYPAQTLAAAAVLGFFAGRAMKGRG